MNCEIFVLFICKHENVEQEYKYIKYVQVDCLHSLERVVVLHTLCICVSM